MSKQAFKRVRRHLKMEVNRTPLDHWAWPGGYPIYYCFTDGGCICPKCVNENIDEIDAAIREPGHFNSHGGWAIDAYDANYEDPDLHCDHCHKRIESAYAEDNVKMEWTTENTTLETWFERDRQYVGLYDTSTASGARNRTIVEWWDDDVPEAIEDGFLDPKRWHESVVEYANHLKAESPA